MILKVIKRNGIEENFNEKKIYRVIELAFTENGIRNKSIIDNIYKKVLDKLHIKDVEVLNIEEIQDVIQRTMFEEGCDVIGEKFIEYRYKHRQQREQQNSLNPIISNICKVTDRENANVGNNPSSKMLQIAEAASKMYAEEILMTPSIKNASDQNKIYIHDFNWAPVGTTTCTVIPLGKLLKNGFNPGHGYIRPPKRIGTAAIVSCIIFQSNQNEQHGGQAFGFFDRDLAPFVKKEQEWQRIRVIETLTNLNIVNLDNIEELNDDSYEEIKEIYNSIYNKLNKDLKDQVDELSWKYTVEATEQAMESVVFNLNTMHARAGAQVPFTSVNIGTDTSKEGRLIAEKIMCAYEKGLGNGEQPLFPNIIFKVKEGVNYEEDSPNFDLLKIALRVSSKRLFPTFSFQDSSINKPFPEDITYMGCRTRAAFNIHSDKQTCESRGNLSFTTINLSSIALENKTSNTRSIDFENTFNKLKDKFNIVIPNKYDDEIIRDYFVRLNKYVDLTIEQLLNRIKYQSKFTKADFPFLMNGVWMDSDNLKDNDVLEEVLKHGTLGIGTIALAETLITLIGKHHGECKYANELGLAIYKFLDAKSKWATEKYLYNFAILATPAEGLCGKTLSKDKKIYGEIVGVTDKDWYTNSYHIPVEYEIGIFEKINIEGAYSKYCGGGHITYVELNESPLGNPKAYYKIIKAMKEADVSYGSINFPCDRCTKCNTFGVINDNCPNCNSEEIDRIRRITGYLAKIENFNYAKKQEVLNRVKHLNINNL